LAERRQELRVSWGSYRTRFNVALMGSDRELVARPVSEQGFKVSWSTTFVRSGALGSSARAFIPSSHGAATIRGQPGFRRTGPVKANVSVPLPVGFGVRNLTSRRTASRRFTRAPAAGDSATTVPIRLLPPGVSRPYWKHRPAPSRRATAFGKDRPTTQGTVTVARAWFRECPAQPTQRVITTTRTDAGSAAGAIRLPTGSI
jgi:hypothetical protein